jgi:hypothetical protein
MSIKVSIFDSHRNTTPINSGDLNTVLANIKDGRWQDHILAYRTGKTTKDKLPAFTTSGEFKARKSDQLIQHSGFICMDIDEQDNPNIEEGAAKLRYDPLLYAMFRSAGGKGYCAIFPIDPNRHLDAYLGLEKRIADRYELIVDRACKDVTRLRYVSYDPDLYISDKKPARFKDYLPKPSAPVRAQYVGNESDSDYMIAQIVSRNINLCEGYQDWYRVGCALISKYKDDPKGLDHFHTLSQMSAKYNSQKCDAKYAELQRSSRREITFATLVYMARSAGVETQTEQTKRIERMSLINRARVGVAGGFRSTDDARKETISYLTEVDGLEDVEERVTQAFALEEKDIEKPSADEMLDALKAFIGGINIRMNEITRNYEKAGDPVTDRELNTIYLQAVHAYGSKVKKQLVFDIIDSENTARYNPFAEFFAKHASRQPRGNFIQLVDCIHTKNHDPFYIANFLKKWLHGVVASMHYDYSVICLVLTGAQGIGKTNFFRYLLPEEIRGYYGESKLDAGKDDEILMCKKIILCDDEFGGKSKQEAKKLKELSSRQTFTIRKPYGKVHEELRRVAVLCGTSNEAEIINDPTGNRRIVPIDVVKIDWDSYEAIDKIDLWMEIYNEWKANPKAWYLDEQDRAYLNNNTMDNEQPSLERELIVKYFEPPSANCTKWMTTSMVKVYIDLNSRQSVSLHKTGQQLKALGYIQQSRREEGSKCPIKKWQICPSALESNIAPIL